MRLSNQEKVEFLSFCLGQGLGEQAAKAQTEQEQWNSGDPLAAEVMKMYVEMTGISTKETGTGSEDAVLSKKKLHGVSTAPGLGRLVSAPLHHRSVVGCVVISCGRQNSVTEICSQPASLPELHAGGLSGSALRVECRPN